MNIGFLGPAVATVLTVYGIETCSIYCRICFGLLVATVLTVYGIETDKIKALKIGADRDSCNSTYRLRY